MLMQEQMAGLLVLLFVLKMCVLKKYKLCVILCIMATILTCICHDNDNKTQHENMKSQHPEINELKFFDVDKNTTPNNKLSAYEALIRYSHIQQYSSDGVNFEFEIAYYGKETSSIHNPLYYFQYLMKLSGEYMKIDRKAPIPLINRKAPIQVDDDFNFKLLGIYKNGESLDLDEVVNSSTIDFDNKDRIIFNLQISEYVNSENNQLMSLQPGTYKLELLFSIISSSNEMDNESTRTLKAQEIVITLE